jgi:hypothetical protein
MAGGGRRRKGEGEKARRDHQCPFHGIVLELLVSDDGATIAAPVPSTSPIKQLGFQIVPARAQEIARRAEVRIANRQAERLRHCPRKRAIQ